MKKEFGKWLLDIAKYITTAVILSSVFGEIESAAMYILGILTVASTLLIGLFMVSGKSFRRIRNNNQN